jgi:hypothetical protein
MVGVRYRTYWPSGWSVTSDPIAAPSIIRPAANELAGGRTIPTIETETISKINLVTACLLLVSVKHMVVDFRFSSCRAKLNMLPNQPARILGLCLHLYYDRALTPPFLWTEPSFGTDAVLLLL